MALLRNSETGDLEAAGSVDTPGQDNAEGAWIDFQIGRSVFPPGCCECLGPEAPEAAYRRLLQPAVELIVPLCATAPDDGRARNGLAPSSHLLLRRLSDSRS